MVIGNGLLAKRFSAYQSNDNVVIFASGVSDSKTISAASFLREKTLLLSTMEAHKESILVYFSTCSIEDESLNQTPYVLHKLAMEHLIKDNATKYLIIRLTNMVGKGGNKKNVFNYFFERINNNEPFHLWTKSYRNILDIDDAYAIVHELIMSYTQNRIVNVAAAKSNNALEIVQAIEFFLGKKARYTEEDKGRPYEIDTVFIQEIIKKLKIDFGDQYLQRILKKYFGNEL